MYTYKSQSFIICVVVVMLFVSLITAAAQTSSTATPTPIPTRTPAPTATMTATPTPQGTEIVLKIAAGQDDVNESGGNLAADQNDLWFGNAGPTNDHYLGLRFTDVTIPPGSIIHNAHLEVYYTEDQWIFLAYDLMAEAADNSAPFSADNMPSQRQLTEATVPHESDQPWLANTWYPLDEIAELIQEVISRPEWQIGNSLAIIAQGNSAGGDYGRKFFSAFEKEPVSAVRLVIDFTPATMATGSLVPTQTLIANATATAIIDPCSKIVLQPRLTIGQRGQRISNPSTTPIPVNVRLLPSLASDPPLTQLEQGIVFTVIDGPVCADEVRWFKVRFGDDEGWLAEGLDRVYYVEPLP